MHTYSNPIGARTGALPIVTESSPVTIPLLDARIQTLASEILLLPLEENRDFIFAFREWYTRWTNWRDNTAKVFILSGGTKTPSSDPATVARLKSWVSDVDSWEQGYGFISRGIMPSSPGTPPVSPSQVSSVKPFTFILISGFLAVIVYFISRRS